MEPDPIVEQLKEIGQQLADEKLVRKQAEQAQNALGVQLSAEVVAREKTEMLNKALGEQLVSLKLELLNVKGE